MLREALDRKGAAPEHDVVLAMVAEPDVVSLPAFTPPVTTPAGGGGLNRLTTWCLVVGGIPKRAGAAMKPGGRDGSVRF
jgi:hypothetical protein